MPATDGALVIGVAGPAGSGKSTLVGRLIDALDGSVALAFDSYPVAMPPDLARWLAAGADFDAWAAPELEAALVELVGRHRTVVFEAPLGRAHSATGRLIDVLVFIDLPPEVALARFVGRELSRGPDASAMLAEYLSMYEDVLREVYAEQRRQVMGTADVIVDGLAPPYDMVHEVLDRLEAR